MAEVQRNRTMLESTILTAARSLREDGATACLDSQGVEAFLAAWRRLVAYYEQYDDRTIAVEMVREYLDGLKRFSTIWHSGRRTADCQMLAAEACEELESCMDDIIKAVEQHLYPTGR